MNFDLLQAAVDYSKRGLAVFPLYSITEDGRCTCLDPNCQSPGKHPRTYNGLYAATTDEAQIRSWWNKWPAANIGIPTGGLNGLVVVDVDGITGRESLRDLPVPVTPRVQTGREHGFHLYFAHPGFAVSNSQGKLPGIDIRGNGGYVVAAPSMHHTGRRYAWVDGCDLETPLAECPGWLLELILKGGDEATQRPVDTAAILQGVPEGQRDMELFRLACKLRRADVPMEAAVELVLKAAANCKPPFPEKQAIAKVASAYGRYDGGDTGGGETCEPQEPIPLTEYNTPLLPRGLFPPWVEDMVAQVAASTETPYELAASLALGVLATCCAKRFSVNPEGDYFEPLNLWIASALPSGHRKSAVLNLLTQPLVDHEHEQLKKIAPAIQQAASKRKTLEARIKKLRDKAAVALNQELEKLTTEISALEQGLPPIPVVPRLFTQDVTPEHLGTMLSDHNERMAIISDEGGIFDLMAGRYNGGIPNLDVFLQGHSGSPIRVDRGSRPSVMLNLPALSIILSPQPDVLFGLANQKGFRGRGLLARFIFLLPASKLGHRTLELSHVEPKTKVQYSQHVMALLDKKPVEVDGEERPRGLHFSKEAWEIWKQHARSIEVRMQCNGDFESMTDWAGKFPGAVARIAGLLHCAEFAIEQPEQVKVSGKIMKSAIALADVLAAHTQAVFALMGCDPSMEMAQKVLRYIEHNRLSTFTKSEIWHPLRGTFKTAKEIDPALDVLVETNHITIDWETRAAGRKGRPPTRFWVNPILVEKWQGD